MENKFNHLKQELQSAQTVDEVQELLFRISEEKIEVAMQSDGLMVYAETSYLHQLEKYAERLIKEMSNEKFSFLNLYFIESRRALEKELHKEIKNKVHEKLGKNGKSN